MSELKLFMILLGCKPPGRHVEQHDFFFGIASSLKDLVPEIEAFWPEAPSIHLDGWREVTVVEDHEINIRLKSENISQESPKLFFINLGGYTKNKFEEQHYVLLTVKDNKADAFNTAKQTLFFKNNHFEAASTHIDDKYGIDVDDLYEIEELLTSSQKDTYQIELLHSSGQEEDPVYLGYFKLSSL
ncbi:MAG TPA: DUF1543 domain-containing protein [Sphingobacteriaceae bacterium]|nr:DUF1543 domain-containing protein [Sphingobacteriaceae bacterium]